MIRTVAIDDEPKALELLQRYIEDVPFMLNAGLFRDPLRGITSLENNSADLLLLDINMPNLSGMKVRQLLSKPPLIIFTTAYSEFALESYEQDAVDYLLKPISFERFLKGALKAKSRLEGQVGSTSSATKLTYNPLNKERFIFIKSGTKSYRIDPRQVKFLEKDGNYMYIHLEDKRIMSRLSIQNAMDLLRLPTLVRIHKSFVINIPFIDVLEREQLIIRDRKIPISSSYRKAFFEKIDLHKDSA